MGNPSSNSVLAQFCLDLQSSAQGVPGIVSSQVIIGHTEFEVCEDFYQRVADGGYWIVIGIPRGEGSFFDYAGTVAVPVDLFFPIAADLNVDWTSINNQIAALIAGWATWTEPGNSAWVSGQNRSPVKFKWSAPLIRYANKPCGAFLGKESFIASVQFTFTCPFISDQLANGFYEPPVS